MAVHQLCLGQIPACWTSWKRRGKASFEMKILLVAKYESHMNRKITLKFEILGTGCRWAIRPRELWESGVQVRIQKEALKYKGPMRRHWTSGYPLFPYILTNVLISRCSWMKKTWDYITQFQHCKPTSILSRVCILWLLYKSKFHFIIQPSQASNCGCPRHGWSKHASKKSPKQSSCIRGCS